jgi:hypothetical protein
MFAVVFLCIPAGWESYMTPRQPIGVRCTTGCGGSRRESSILPIVHLGAIYVIIHSFFMKVYRFIT